MDPCPTRELAAKFLAEGEVNAALETWRHLLEREPAPANWLEFAALLFALYRHREAVEVLDRLANLGVVEEKILLGAARLLFSHHRIGEAVAFTARARQINPGNPETAALHANTLERAGRIDDAIAILQECLARFPHHPRCARLLAHIERNRGEFDAAETRLRAALAADPGTETWRLEYELAPLLEARGNAREAMETLMRAKDRLAPQAFRHRAIWRAITERQWEVTRGLEPARLARWAEIAPDLTPPVRICLMAGFPRSGTTLIESRLTRHPAVIGTDESGILATQFRDPMVLGADDAASALAELDGLPAESISAGRSEYLRCTTEHLGEEIGDRWLLEKDPLLTADLALPLRLFPGQKILMPLRDPRDVVISFFFTMVPLAPNSVAAIDLGECCRYYAEVMRHWLRLRDMLPPDIWLEARYKDIIEDPASQTERLTAFLGLDGGREILACPPVVAARPISTPTYADVAKPLYRRGLGRWSRYEKWLKPHLPHLEPFLRAYGYE